MFCWTCSVQSFCGAGRTDLHALTRQKGSEHSWIFHNSHASTFTTNVLVHGTGLKTIKSEPDAVPFPSEGHRDGTGIAGAFERLELIELDQSVMMLRRSESKRGEKHREKDAERNSDDMKVEPVKHPFESVDTPGGKVLLTTGTILYKSLVLSGAPFLMGPRPYNLAAAEATISALSPEKKTLSYSLTPNRAEGDTNTAFDILDTYASQVNLKVGTSRGRKKLRKRTQQLGDGMFEWISLVDHS
ncbi:hypothetical protein P7C73_g4135, partial [Tremellales sp. Uapishka_1]